MRIMTSHMLCKGGVGLMGVEDFNSCEEHDCIYAM